MRKVSLSLRFVAFVFLVAFGSVMAQADDIVAIDFSNFTVTGASVCGASSSSLCTENFSSSFQYDSSTNMIVPGTMTISSGGALGSFVFNSAITFPISPLLTDFDWLDANGDSIDLLFSYASELLPGTSPSGFTFACPLTSPCITEFPSPNINTGTTTVSLVPTPEPSSLLLLGSGLLAIGPLLRRRIRTV